MSNFKIIILVFLIPFFMSAQNVMTPEILWTLKKFSVQVVSPDKSKMIYKVGQVDLDTEKTNNEYFILDLKTGKSRAFDLDGKSILQWDANGLYAQEEEQILVSKDAGKTWKEFYAISNADNIQISPDGKKIAFSREVQEETVLANEKYKDVPNSTGHIYSDLNHRHWDYYNQGKYNHPFVVSVDEDSSKAVDILKGKTWDCPQRPFGGGEDFVWSPDSEFLVFVTKASNGAEYAKSTNTDIYKYVLNAGIIENLTEGNMGYDMNPIFSPNQMYMAWTSMKTDGWESDKNDIKIMDMRTGGVTNLTIDWDESVVGSVAWAEDSKSLFFSTAMKGTQQLFNVGVDNQKVRQITNGNFDVKSIYAPQKDKLWVTRTDFNHNADLYSVNVKDGKMTQVTNVNKATYAKLKPCSSELKMVKTVDGKEMGVWFIYPPDFDPSKKYPTLLYCQGGPQSALSQFFSVRWNFDLMASNGYIIVAPNRRGMPGWGTEWNAEISKEWGNKVMQDYLYAADYAKKLPFVDGERMGCIGASYGGYSVFMLAGMHENQFKTFIAHDGLFDMKSWYLTTEELWFADWDLGGSPFDTPLPKAYTDYNPSNFVPKWTSPIMIIQGGIDYRVPYEQGQEAFQAATLKGLKTKFLYFPNENHWVLHAQNGLVWQREFFEWLKETL